MRLPKTAFFQGEIGLFGALTSRPSEVERRATMADNYDDLIFTLGDIAYERYWKNPGDLTTMVEVIAAGEALEHCKIDLRDLEASMDKEEDAFREFQEAVDEETAQCQELVDKYIKPVKLAESKAKSIEQSLRTKRSDLGVARQNLSKMERQIKQLEADGYVDKAHDKRQALKNLKMDLLKRNRECDDLQSKYDDIMNPKSGPGAEGIRARRRQIDLEQQLDERTDEYNERIQELEDQAEETEGRIEDAQRDFEDRRSAAARTWLRRTSRSTAWRR